MNVYTHVDMEDLAGDLESLPSFLDNPTSETPIHKETISESPDLASLASNWPSLPDHIRQAIATLAGG